MSEIKKLIERLCPDGVEYRKLVDLAEVGTGSSNKQDSTDDGKYPFFVRSKFVERHNDYEYDEEAIIIPGEGGIGDIFHYINGKYALHQRVYRIHFITNSVNAKFAYYYLRNSFKKYILGKAVSATVTSIRKPMIQNFEIPVPPIEVQSKIVEILDNFTELEAELEAKLEAELEARRKQYEYYRNQLLTFDKVGGARFDVKWMKMKDVCSLQRGKVYSKKYISENKGSYPVYSSQTANNGVLGKINSYDYDGTYLTWTTDGAYAGTIFYREGKFNITNVCGLISISQDFLDLRFLYYWLSLTAKKYVYQGMGNPKLMSNQVEMIDIPILPIDEQKRIANILDRFEALTTDLQSGLPAEIEARRKQYEYYREQLLTFKRKTA